MEMPTKKMTYGKTTSSGKTPTSGHDPAGKKVGATAKKMGSTYDYRKKAKKPSKAEKTTARLAKKRAGALKRAAKKKAGQEKKAARKEKKGLFNKKGK